MATHPDQQKVQNNELSFMELIQKVKEWFVYLCSKWVVLLFAIIIGGGLGMIYSVIKKPIYTGTLTFALEEKAQSSVLGAYAGIAGQLGIDLGNASSGAFSEDNIMELMKSRLMVSQALLTEIKYNGKKESLADFYIQFKHFRDNWKGSKRIPQNISFSINANIDSLSYIEDSLMGEFCKQILKNNLTIDKPDTKGSIIAIKCSSTNELFAKCFAEALVKKVTTFYIQTKTTKATQNLDIIQNRLDSVRRAYQLALFGTAESFDKNLNPSRAIASVPRIQSQTVAQILGTEYAELVKNLEIAKMTLLQDTPLIQIIDKPILPLDKSSIGQFKGALIGAFIFIFIGVVVLFIQKYFI